MRILPILAVALALAALAAPLSARRPQALETLKDYLSEAEADQIRDADTPALRIKLYVSFAEDRLKKFEYELNRPVPDRRRSDILNSLLNGYSGCVDDAADQIATADQKHADIRDQLKMMEAKDKEFLPILEKYDKDGPAYEDFKDNLEDAIDATKDAISDIDDAIKDATPGPIRRKPS